MKKLLSLLIVIIMISGIFCGCDASDVKEVLNELAGREKIVFTTPEQFEADGIIRYFYNKLTEDEKYAYIAIYEGIKAHKNEIPIVHISMDEVENVMDALYYDCPEIICTEPEYTYTDWYDISTVELEYMCSYEECQVSRQNIEKAVDDIVASVPEGSDEYQTELYLHDYLISNVSYDFDAYEDYDSNPSAYTAYGALLDGKAVCGGYAGAYHLLLQKAGIQTHLVYGSASGVSGRMENHVWNIVTIDGNDYHVDTTFDDYVYDSGEEYIGYLYFNVTTDDILVDHKIDEEQDVNCTATDQNYFVKNNLIFDTYDNNTREAIKNEIAENLQNDRYIAEFKFSPQSYNGAFADLIDNSSLFPLIEEAEKQTGKQIDRDNVYYDTNEEIGYFCVLLSPAA